MPEVTSTSQTQSSAAAKAQTNLASNFDDFLTLLTTQLTHQDPLNPTDSTEFTNQLVNFSNVEQAIATNQNLEALVQLTQMSQQNALSASMINYLGKSIGTNLNVSELSDGEASWNIDLGSRASSVKYEIYNQEGNIVYTETADGAPSGKQQFTWDGTKSSGSEAEDGAYYLVVKAETEGGSAVNVGYSFKGVATSIETVNGEAVLMVGDVPIGLGYITSVTEPATTDPSA
ncbi:gliding motility-associated C-terminal domain-containing protein [Sneathiella sp. CAU 1612]|uniref:Basal-body rod modification protein FlgD n=1 Tax=Sneathiella sedimenti TaxID=2816034 RepID=A0ABS3F9J1_9PROT|nr:flagellar hook capping FlgD N-terminal domain-containing protein [Sneathiella sedimenti]MBO0335200.1 gliding motility-associated C-terminal domain-containing protein [Sneathiella sedimenti]